YFVTLNVLFSLSNALFLINQPLLNLSFIGAQVFSFLFKELKKYGVTTLVRVCDATYDQAPIEKEGIQVLVSCL
uniref:Uncharacterized protein n=1 Tax=Cyanistes caeruleus TaxID=156563 RepID=A0A8C0UBR8_CYACU